MQLSKKWFCIFVLVACLGWEGKSLAYCSGTVSPNEDCSEGMTASCCPLGTRVYGVAYSDGVKSDGAVQISAVCRAYARGSDTLANTSMTISPIRYVCEPHERFAGIACKDLKGKDQLDGCTALCQKPGRKHLRVVFNPDLSENPNQFRSHAILMPKRVTGIVYASSTKRRKSYLDCATISFR